MVGILPHHHHQDHQFTTIILVVASVLPSATQKLLVGCAKAGAEAVLIWQMWMVLAVVRLSGSQKTSDAPDNNRALPGKSTQVHISPTEKRSEVAANKESDFWCWVSRAAIMST